MTIEGLRKAGAAVARLGNSGAALVEFAFLAPWLVLIMLGTTQFGLVLSIYVMLVNAVNAGALNFSISRGVTPYTSTVTVIDQSASLLNTTTLNSNITMSVNGTACTSDASCNTLMTGPGLPVKVMATYPCNSFPYSLNVAGYNFGCTSLSAQLTEYLQ
jgi:Flp pilus assembly protein TadG